MAATYERLLSQLPLDWPRQSLADLGAIRSGGTPARDVPAFWGGGLHWVTPGELTRLESKYLTNTADTLTKAGLSTCSACLLPPLTLLVTTRATIGEVALAAIPVATNQGFKSIVLRDSADPHFYYHFFSLVTPELVRRASGTTFLEIPGREFSKVEVPLPPLREQRLIAEILDALDETIRKTEQVIAKLKQMKQGLLHYLLTRGIDENGELRDPIRNPEQFKDSPLGRIPREWEVGELGKVVDLLRPIVYGILMPGYGFPGGVPVIKVKDILGGRVRTDDLLLTDPRIDQEYARSRLRTGDLLFTIRGTVGRMAFVPPTLDGANITQDTARISVNGARSDPRFVFQSLQSPTARRYSETHTIGQAVKGLNLRELRRVPLALPIAEEQAVTGRILMQADLRIETEDSTLSKLRLLKSGLMDDLLTGRVRVTVPPEAA